MKRPIRVVRRVREIQGIQVERSLALIVSHLKTEKPREFRNKLFYLRERLHGRIPEEVSQYQNGLLHPSLVLATFTSRSIPAQILIDESSRRNPISYFSFPRNGLVCPSLSQILLVNRSLSPERLLNRDSKQQPFHSPECRRS